MVHDIRPNRKRYEIATAIAHSSLDTKLCSTHVANESNFTGPSDYKVDKLISKLVLKMELSKHNSACDWKFKTNEIDVCDDFNEVK